MYYFGVLLCFATILIAIQDLSRGFFLQPRNVGLEDVSGIEDSQGHIEEAVLIPSVSINEYWPDLMGDLTRVTFGHGINSKAKLQGALQNAEVMMIEADVGIGTLVDSTGKHISGNQVIMVHPPSRQSDLSFESFMSRFLQAVKSGAKKGLKLDFKDISAVQPTLTHLKGITSQLEFPLWFNADIMPGPGYKGFVTQLVSPINAERFLQLCSNNFPGVLLSLGWTTTGSVISTDRRYSQDMIQDMLITLNHNKVTAPLTFAVRAIHAVESIESLTFLLESATNMTSHPATLTVWSSPVDTVSVRKFMEFKKALGYSRLFIDVPAVLTSRVQLCERFGLMCDLF